MEIIAWINANRELAGLAATVGIATIAACWKLYERFNPRVGQKAGHVARVGRDMQASVINQGNSNTVNNTNIGTMNLGSAGLPTAPTPKRVSPLTWSEIRKAIADALPLHADDVADQFIGNRVRWKVFFDSATKRKPPDDALCATSFSMSPTSSDIAAYLFAVRCELSLAEYPELKRLPKHAPVGISGEIERAARTEVALIRRHS